jgi:hypothetical protein
MRPEAWTLAATQAGLQQHVLDGAMAVGAAIRTSAGIGTEQRLAIYHHAYRARLLDALRDSFAHCWRWMGDDLFDEHALGYIEQQPPQRAGLGHYGEGFPRWLALHLPERPWIGELAQLDWTLRRAFDGPDAPVLTLAELATVAADAEAWSRCGFRVHPTTRRLSFGCNTLALWGALDADEEPPAPMQLPSASDVLIWRRDHQPHFRSLGSVESRALTALLGGASFALMCATLAEVCPADDVATTAGTLLRRWIDDGLLSRCVIHPD